MFWNKKNRLCFDGGKTRNLYPFPFQSQFLKKIFFAKERNETQLDEGSVLKAQKKDNYDTNTHLINLLQMNFSSKRFHWKPLSRSSVMGTSIRSGVNAIQSIFGTSWRPYFTGLTMGTYLNWPEKKSGKTDNENFSVSQIPHVAFFGRHKIWYQRTALPRPHPKGAIKHTQGGDGEKTSTSTLL